eukprot:6481621-Alexandrium_andersonii.AAC.1
MSAPWSPLFQPFEPDASNGVYGSRTSGRSLSWSVCRRWISALRPWSLWKGRQASWGGSLKRYEAALTRCG